MEGEELDFVFKTKDGAATIRDCMQTLAPRLEVESNVIDTFFLVLNHEQKMNSKGKKTKYFFHTTMITKDMLKWKKANGKNDEKKQYEAFSKTIKSEFKKDPEMKNMKDLEMRQFDSILDGLAEVPSNDRVFGQWLNALFQKAAFLSRLLPRGLFGISSKTTSE
ncbi:hypothetical protein Tco_1028574 [Tanacetum coccineum]|uniref:Uncharacterized protein n=1 Tax=Tanacetum coccineum TaxID=301880 RepID=A0ABQ5G281_9ASTR